MMMVWRGVEDLHCGEEGWSQFVARVRRMWRVDEGRGGIFARR